MLRRVIIVQARLASRRLPGKVLELVSGRPLIERQWTRLRRCRQADAIWLATSDQASDQPLVDWAQRHGAACFQGDANDVLGRYVACAAEARADVVVRVTADCPLVDPTIIDRVIAELVEHQGDCDYASNVLERTYPRGLDVEAFFRQTLLRMHDLCQSPASREHVTLGVRSEFPHRFATRSVRDFEDNSDLRWTVDVPEDLELIRRLDAEFDLDRPELTYAQLLRQVRARPELMRFNAAVETWDPLTRQQNATSIAEGAS